ncbi:MAG: arginine--tRNA ligase [Patescibacteria group bacterium]
MEIKDIQEHIIKLIKSKLVGLSTDFIIDLEIPPNPKMGDLAVGCFRMAKILKKSPEKIAQDLALKIKPDEIIEKINNTGPYLNFFLKKENWFKTVCQEILDKKDKFGNSDFGQKKKILIEYSAPNTNKPQHLGHLRNNFLGMAVANLFSCLGFKAIKVNLINDRGIHICKSMLAYQKWGENKTPESENMKGDHFVGKYYVLFEEKAKEDPKLLDEAQELLRKWENRDTETLALWQKMNRWAINGFSQTYKKIGTEFDKIYYESETYKLGKKIILKALKKGLCYKRPDGAVEVDLTKDGLDKKVLIRADGTSVYVTQDIGLAKLKYDDFKPDRSIYVVASEQEYHFKVLFTILPLFGFKWVKNLYHLSYGLVFLPEGKMKSREGKVVDADEIIAEVEKLAKGEILAREPNISPIELSARAEKIALGAIKFFFLKVSPKQEINFKPEESISFEGATGPYIQYTYARIQSILRKSNIPEGEQAPYGASQHPVSLKENKLPTKQASIHVDYSNLGAREEVEILKLLFIFPDILQRATLAMDPSVLANYLLKLCQFFNEFYHQHPVLQAEEKIKIVRLNFITSIAEIIKKGLDILGIQTLEIM